MRYYIDFEFIEDGTTIDPISLGIVGEDGRELYIEFVFDQAKVGAVPWLVQNVLPFLVVPPGDRLTFEQARVLIERFMQGDAKPEVWACYGDYDWVCMCRIFGKMIDLPTHWPKLCLDLQQHFKSIGSPAHTRPKKSSMEHFSLADARWNRAFHDNMLRFVREQQRIDQSFPHRGPSRREIPLWLAQEAFNVGGDQPWIVTPDSVREEGGFFDDDLDGLVPGWRDRLELVTLLRQEIANGETYASELRERAERAELDLHVLAHAVRTRQPGVQGVPNWQPVAQAVLDRILAGSTT